LRLVSAMQSVRWRRWINSCQLLAISFLPCLYGSGTLAG
jgi:hypothetical protein